MLTTEEISKKYRETLINMRDKCLTSESFNAEFVVVLSHLIYDLFIGEQK